MTWDVVKFYWAHSLDTLVSSPSAAVWQGANNVLSTFERDIWRASTFDDYHLTFDAGSGGQVGIDYFVVAAHNLHTAKGYVALKGSDTEVASLDYGWTEVACGASVRADHTSAVINNKIYVHAGFTGAIYLSDLWEYDIAADTWSEVSCNGSNFRMQHSAVVIGSDMYIYGGYGPGYLSNCWKYNPSSDLWTEVACTSFVRVSHSACVMSGEMYIFGGADASTHYNDLWKYNPSSDLWTEVACGASNRHQHTAAVINNEMYIYGGTGTGGPYSDLWKYNPGSNLWTEVACGATQRYGHTAVAMFDEMYIYGGFYLGRKNDLWKYNPSSDIWTEADCGASVRESHSAVAISGVQYIYGGSDGSSYRMDLWRDVEVINPWQFFTYVVSPFLPSSGTTQLIEVGSVAYRLWAIEISSLSGDALPYIGIAHFGFKTELDYVKVKTDPNAQEDRANVVVSETGRLLGIHDKYVERQVSFEFEDFDGTLYAKIDEWWRAVGRKNFVVAWESTEHPNDVWLMRSEAGYENVYKVGGTYRDIKIKLTGRRE